ncbi:MAG: hypothetical protein GXP50_11030 [Deltaproteobacteria bacterium]|nr:hypothetical protein [Deltaproteobacteria bacterium]
MSVRQRVLAWTLEVDPAATRRLYRAVGAGFASGCGCLACRNFDAARPARYGPAFRKLLASLGVDPRKEREVRWVTPLEGGLHLYAGAYLCVGEIVAGRPYRGFPFAAGATDVFERVSERVHAAVRPWMAPEGAWAGRAVVRIEFLVMLPWVLPEGPERAVDLASASHRPRGRDH